MQHCGQVSRQVAGRPLGRRVRWLAALAAVLLPVLPAAGQPGGLFTAVGPARAASAPRVSRTPPEALTLRQRLVTIDLGQLAPPGDAALRGAAAGAGFPPSGVLTLNLFDDAVFTALIERTAPTFSGGRSLSGRLAGIETGTMTLVVNGDVVAGTVRTPEATYRVRPAAGGLHTISQIDPAQLPPLGEPLRRRSGDDLQPVDPILGGPPPPLEPPAR